MDNKPDSGNCCAWKQINLTSSRILISRLSSPFQNILGSIVHWGNSVTGAQNSISLQTGNEIHVTLGFFEDGCVATLEKERTIHQAHTVFKILIYLNDPFVILCFFFFPFIFSLISFCPLGLDRTRYTRIFVCFVHTGIFSKAQSSEILMTKPLSRCC